MSCYYNAIRANYVYAMNRLSVALAGVKSYPLFYYIKTRLWNPGRARELIPYSIVPGRENSESILTLANPLKSSLARSREKDLIPSRGMKKPRRRRRVSLYSTPLLQLVILSPVAEESGTGLASIARDGWPLGLCVFSLPLPLV